MQIQGKDLILNEDVNYNLLYSQTLLNIYHHIKLQISLVWHKKSYYFGDCWCLSLSLVILTLAIYLTSKAATRGVLYKKAFLEILQKSQENICASVSFLIKLQTWLQAFSCEFCEICKDIYFTENLWTTAYTASL